MKRLLIIACAMIVTMSACAQKKKAVVAYFSATGTTEAAAKEIAKELKADLYKIEPQEVYTDADLDWRNKESRSSVEMKDKACRPALKEAKSLAKYKVVYIGYPIWWGVAPRIINTFVEQAKLEGKKVIPFATSGGSTVERSVKELKASYPEIDWQEGILK